MILATLRRAFVGPAWAAVSVFPLVLCNVLQTLSLVIVPFSRPAYQGASLQFVVGVWTWWAVMIERIHGTRIIVDGDELPAGESAVVFANHQSMADVVLLICCARRLGRMADMRWMVKNSLRYVPFLGWAMVSLDFIFLKRNWAKDREHVQATFARFRVRAEPVWLVLFPEGTRRTPAKQGASQEGARQRGQAVTTHVMQPRTKGFVASVRGLEGKIGAIYRVTIAYAPGPAPDVYALFAGPIGDVRLSVKRYPISTVPPDDDALAAWLQREFVAMDALLARAGNPLGDQCQA